MKNPLPKDISLMNGDKYGIHFKSSFIGKSFNTVEALQNHPLSQSFCLGTKKEDADLL